MNAVAQSEAPRPRKPIRLWPGVAAVVLQWLIWFVVPIVAPGAAGAAMLGGLGCGLLVLLWWLFFSRARWFERLGAIALMVVGLYATARLVHESIANGMMGMMLPIVSIPFLSLALVASAAAGRRLPDGPRRALMVAAILLACGAMTLVRTGGITADADSDFHWRWSETPEQRLLARGGDAPAARPADSASATVGAEWPGFRGAARDGIVRGVRIDTDWSAKPPVELWRRPVGPGWSSFAVQGHFIYTQEQRGDDEVVSCYDLSTGEPVWRHGDRARFWESNAGAGPRATPTLDHGRVYTLGGTGILNALDARDGSVVWSRNAVSDTGAKVPHWGIAGSPLVVGDLVVAAAAGRLAAYDAATGSPRWSGPPRGGGYSSPHLATIGGVEQIVLLNGAGAIGVAPSDGALLWEHAWSSDGIVQPALTDDGDVLLGSGSGLADNNGMLRVTVAHGSDGWSVNERWMSTGLKPYFNDFVVHAGHAFGFDGSILACIDLQDGKRTWKGGRYGHGQLVLLADQDVLLVLSEQGELALVQASPDRFTELARFPAIEGKTWNHPVLVGDVLLVRNDQEMAAFRLTLTQGGAESPRHLIYLHGRIVQEQQSARPRHPEYGTYELEQILDAFRGRGFVVSGEIRPGAATVDESADHVAEQVRRLLASGVSADHITVVGASMGASIAFQASARLQNPDLRFAVLGACLSENVRALLAEGEKGPSGHLLAIREASDELSDPCPPWKADPGGAPSLDAREIVLDTGLRHGFIYRPLPEWVDPLVEWARASAPR